MKRKVGRPAGGTNKRRSITTHGLVKTRVYKSWLLMWTRCTNPNIAAWKTYGGRGISVDKRWEIFENFLADMEHPKPDQTLDRIDVNGNYTPKNCRWLSFADQSRNRRSNIWVEINGEYKLVSDWCKIYKVNHATALMRHKAGADWVSAITKSKAYFKKLGYDKNRKSQIVR